MITYILGLLAIVTLYTEVNLFLIKRRVKGPVEIVKGAEPFFYKQGNIGVLLLHGFTSSPPEFNDIAKTLKKEKYTVLAPLLPGHGTTPERLAITKYYQWVEAVDASLTLLAKECDRIVIVGNSIGANLALIAAAKHRKVQGVVSLGAPIFFRYHPSVNLLVPILKRITIFQKKRYKNLEKIKKIRKRIGNFSYKAIPIQSLTMILKIIKLSKKSLKNIKSPVLVMQTKNDEFIDNRSGQYILNNIQAKKKFLKTVPESYHVFMLDKHKAIVKKEILKFIKTVIPKKHGKSTHR